MRYAIVFGEKALDGIPDWTPREVVDILDRELARLAEDPVSLSEPIPLFERLLPQHPRAGQRYRFACEHGNMRFEFAIYFYYLENEFDLRVYDVELDWSESTPQ